MVPQTSAAAGAGRVGVKVLAERADAPEVSFSTRGSKALAMKLTETPEQRRQALLDYERGKFSASGPSTRESAWNTWCAFHLRMFGDSALVPVLPLCPGKVAGVLAMFKLGKYRSVENYCTVAAQKHILAGYRMDEQLELELKFGKRSVARGLGPGEQSAEIPVDKLMEVDIPDVPTGRNMPLGCINEAVVS